jgi:predicted RNase H-like HicB family nuclease
MDHKGIRYELLQTVSGWKWVAHISHTKQATGFSSSRELAIRAAKRAIEKALEEAEDDR